MTLKEIDIVVDAIIDLGDFMEANSLGVKNNNIHEELSLKYNEAIRIMDQEKEKIIFRNALAKAKRKLMK